MPFGARVIGILRGVDRAFFGDIMHASFASGLEAIEITMNTEGAEKIIAANRPKVPAGRLLGMGTIRNRTEAERAVDAGAMFLVTPNLDIAVIEFARSRSIPIVAGALTPTEIYAARTAGADLIKVFPCGSLGGPRYILELRGPFDTIPLAAVGGVALDNVGDYFAAGADAVGIGASLFGKEAMARQDPVAVAKNVKIFIDRCHIKKDVL